MPYGNALDVQDMQAPASEAAGRLAQVNAGKRSPAELSASASQRLSVLGEMTGGIAHDFRNILAIIDSGLKLAEKHCGDQQKVRGFLAGARQGVVRGTELTSQLLAFAKQRELQPSAGDANELLRSLELFLKYGAGATVQVNLDLSPDIPKCVVDPSQFAAAILNLVINARDAMPEGGDIHISTARPVIKPATPGVSEQGAYVRVRVEDTGLGMTEEVIRKIFDPLFTTKGENGTGLGIPQVCAFMRYIGGHVGVASEPGRGTKFDLFFPAV